MAKDIKDGKTKIDKKKTNANPIYLKDQEVDNKYASAEFTVNEDPFKGV